MDVISVENRNHGAVRMGRMWLIPKDAAKPEDMRTKRTRSKGSAGKKE